MKMATHKITNEIEIPFNPTTTPLNPGPASEFDVTLSLPP
jgi:hypothetical protein